MARGSAPGERRGGRKKGTPNKKSDDIRALCEKEAGCPLPVLLVRWGKQALEYGEIGAAIAALSQAAKYCNPQLKSVELSGEVKTMPTLNVTIAAATPPAPKA